MITIPIKDYHNLKEAERVLIAMLLDQEAYIHLAYENGKITFFDNRDDELVKNIAELEAIKEVITKMMNYKQKKDGSTKEKG